MDYNKITKITRVILITYNHPNHSKRNNFRQMLHNTSNYINYSSMNNDIVPTSYTQQQQPMFSFASDENTTAGTTRHHMTVTISLPHLVHST
ncbi:hypothetical protein RhiirA4_400446 [Rhizophagus irregularis]|uniref:Uncharacterized protein n=1 Tax=Rhizophagus irregularis TaxID=588596 RepID=A0A2I1GE71_9GLOM|nr:hypothetical protein RhiirA4_400446 [Rhizophagus irregularis]